MRPKDSTRQSSSRDGSAGLDNTGMVYKFAKDTDSETSIITKNGQDRPVARKRQATSTTQETSADGCKSIRQTLREQRISSRATNIMLAAWKPGTHKQYNIYIQKWYKFCTERKIDRMQPHVNQVLDFLVELFDSGLSYSAINTARSALSQIILCKEKACTIGAHPHITRFMKGVFNLRPPVPRYTIMWDVGKLLKKLRKLSPLTSLSLKELTLKMVALVAIVLAARSQTIVALNVKNMTVEADKFCFTLNTHLKQSRPGYRPPLIELESYSDKHLCIYRAMTEYLKRTNDLRGGDGQLFISYTKPHKKVCAETVARWIRSTMGMAGINVEDYKAHSVRSATTSKASGLGVPIEEIMRTVGWTNARTFATHYKKTH